MGMFKWKRYDEWIANVQWLDSRWMEYVPMNILVHASKEFAGALTAQQNR